MADKFQMEVNETSRLEASNDSSSPSGIDAWKETRLLLNLAIPTVIIQLGAVFPPFLSASYVGRQFGSAHLDGFTLAYLTGNLFTLSLLQGLFSASDTLSPQAFGAGNHREVGLLAIRGFCGSMSLMVPINIVLLIFMHPVFLHLGEDPDAALYATQWYRIYAFALPFYALYMVTWKFLSAQEIMMPLVYVSLVCCFVITPLALEVLTRTIGYLGSAWAIFTFQASQSLLLLLYLKIQKPHSVHSWPGIGAWREAVQLGPFREYMMLGVGGVVASSGWIYWETLTLMIGTLGVVPLSVHTVPTQVLMVEFMIPLGIGIALAVRLGSTLPQSVSRAKKLVMGVVLGSSVLFAIMTILMYTQREWIFSVFTSEPDVLEGCEQIWGRVSFYFFNQAVFGVNMGIAVGLGMQWFYGFVTVFFLWGLSIPAIAFFALMRQGGLNAAWNCIYPPYLAMNSILLIAFATTDWHKISTKIRIREGMETLPEDLKLQESLVYGSMSVNDKTTDGVERNGA